MLEMIVALDTSCGQDPFSFAVHVSVDCAHVYTPKETTTLLTYHQTSLTTYYD